jgi:hypothetical protein
VHSAHTNREPAMRLRTVTHEVAQERSSGLPFGVYSETEEEFRFTVRQERSSVYCSRLVLLLKVRVCSSFRAQSEGLFEQWVKKEASKLSTQIATFYRYLKLLLYCNTILHHT